MKEKIYNYLVAALYGEPSCKHCQHKELDMQRTPCSYCRVWSEYKLNSKDAAHLERKARYIVKIIEEKRIVWKRE